MILERARDDATFVAELQAEFSELTPVEQQLATAPDKIEVVDPRIAGNGSTGTLGLIRDDRERRAARERLVAKGITHVVFGHTHTVVDGELGGRLLNYGTWLKKLDLKSEHVKAKIKTDGITLDLLNNDSLYTVERIAVRIDADSPYESRVRLVADDDP